MKDNSNKIVLITSIIIENLSMQKFFKGFPHLKF